MFRISCSTNVIGLILRFWNVMGNMRRLLKINVNFKQYIYKKQTNPKSQDVFHNICRVRDSEHNKKETVF